jgi:hypothetical protein
MSSIVFITHEDLDHTAVSRAMFSDVAKALSVNENRIIHIISGAVDARKSSSGYTYFRRRCPGKISFRDCLSFVSCALKATATLLRADIIVCRSYPSMAVFGLYASFFGKKVVFDTRGLFFDELASSGALRSNLYRRVFEYVEKRLLKGASIIVCVTESQKEIYGQRHRLSEGHMEVIGNGSPLSPLHADKSGTKTLQLVYVGSLVTWHCPHLINEFCKELQRLDFQFHLDVITRDTDSAARIFDGSYQKDIFSHNFRKDPIRYDFAFCFISEHLSKKVCYPVKFNEYCNSGTPILALDTVDVVNQIVKDNNFGMIIPASASVQTMVDMFLERVGDRYLVSLPVNATFDFQVSEFSRVIGKLL